MKAYNQLNNEDKENILRLFNDGLECRDIHKKLMVSERSVPRVLKELGVNTKRRGRYTLNENYFNVIDNEKKAYILGLIYSDGFVGDEKTNNIIISLKITDIDILEKISSELELTKPLRHHKSKGFNDCDMVTLNFSSKIMANDLRKTGIPYNKSYTLKNMPELQSDLIRHFIRGYFDGDCSIGIYSNAVSKTLSDGTIKVYEYKKPAFSVSGTKDFLEDMKSKLPCTKFHINNSKSECTKYLQISSVKNMISLFKYIYDDATIYIKRRFNKWNEVLSAINN